MDYLTNFYKNKCINLQEKVNYFKNLLNEEAERPIPQKLEVDLNMQDVETGPFFNLSAQQLIELGDKGRLKEIQSIIDWYDRLYKLLIQLLLMGYDNFDQIITILRQNGFNIPDKLIIRFEKIYHGDLNDLRKYFKDLLYHDIYKLKNPNLSKEEQIWIDKKIGDMDPNRDWYEWTEKMIERYQTPPKEAVPWWEGIFRD